VFRSQNIRSVILQSFSAGCFFSLGIAALSVQVAHAGPHTDVEILLPTANGSIVTAGGDYVGDLAGRVFEGEFISNLATEPGFDAQTGTFAPGAEIRFDVVKQLMYWNGTALVAPTSNVAISFGINAVTVTGTDYSGLPGFRIGTAGLSGPGTGGFHTDLDFDLSAGAPDGLYGVVLTLGPQAPTTGFTTSLPFLMAFSQGTVANPSAGLDAMANAALVPEPSSVVLAGLGAAGALAAGCRRRRRGAAKNSAVSETVR
jgi:hypothetical protein